MGELLSWIFAIFYFIFIGLFLYEAIKDWKRERFGWFVFYAILVFYNMIFGAYYIVTFLAS